MKYLLLALIVIVFKVGHAQTYLYHLDSCYLVLDEVPNKNMVAMGSSYPEFLLYNIHFDVPESELKYLLTLSVLPTPSNRTPTKKQIPARSVRQKKLVYDQLKQAVVTSLDSAYQQYNFESNYLKTYKVIPVIQEEGHYYRYTNPVLSECLGTVSQPPPFAPDTLTQRDARYISEVVVPFYRDGILNLSAPAISQRQIVAFSYWTAVAFRKLHPLYFSGALSRVDSTNMNSDLNNVFLDRTLLKEVYSDSVYHFAYTPAPVLHGKHRTGLSSFYYYPCVGVIGASYRYHFEQYYRWIPGVEAKNIIQPAQFINGAEFEPYFRTKCLE